MAAKVSGRDGRREDDERGRRRTRQEDKAEDEEDGGRRKTVKELEKRSVGGRADGATFRQTVLNLCPVPN